MEKSFPKGGSLGKRLWLRGRKKKQPPPAIASPHVLKGNEGKRLKYCREEKKKGGNLQREGGREHPGRDFWIGKKGKIGGKEKGGK